jgi:hypothetical protein
MSRFPTASIYPVQQRVIKGMAFLDANAIPSWEQAIDLDRLDLADQSRCVLGQIYGNYSTGWSETGVGGTAADNGFIALLTEAQLDELTSSERSTLTADEYELLTEAWREAIAARLAR